jgi:hypothetical protein
VFVTFGGHSPLKPDRGSDPAAGVFTLVRWLSGSVEQDGDGTDQNDSARQSYFGTQGSAFREEVNKKASRLCEDADHHGRARCVLDWQGERRLT